CRALSTRLRRPVTAEDLGLARSAPVDAALGVTYPDTAEAAVAVLSSLWDADLNESLTTIAAEASAWSETSFAWLVNTAPDAFWARAGGQRVGVVDIAAVRATVTTFAILDNEFGGNHARRALIEFLRTDIGPLLRGSYSSTVGRNLHSAAGEATLLAAWMSY